MIDFAREMGRYVPRTRRAQAVPDHGMTGADVVPMNDALRGFERWYWGEVFRRSGTVIRAARMAGTHRSWVYHRLRRMELIPRSLSYSWTEMKRVW